MAKREPIVKVDWTGKLQVYSFSDYLPMRALAHRVKDGDKEGIDKAAKIMAGLVMTVPDYKDGILVPMPGRNGKAGYTKALADEIASLLGLEVQDVLTVKPHKSLYEKKAKNGIDGLRPFKFVATGQIPKEKQPILIDNVLDTGTTAMSAFKTLGDKTSLVVLGSTVNYRRYNYPISIHMEDHKADRRTADDLRKELVTTISDALYFNGFNKRDINAWKQQPFKHEKTLSGMLNHPVLISTFDKPIVRIGYDHESWGRLGECLYSSDGEQLFADRLNNVQDMDALLHELHNTYFNQRGNVLSTLGRHAFKVGEAIQLNNLDYRVMEIGTFHSLLKPFGASGVKLMDDARHRRYTGVSNKSILHNAEILMKSGRPHRLRIPLIPGVNDTVENLDVFAGFVSSVNPLTPIELLPYHKTAGAKYEMVGMEYKPIFQTDTKVSTHPEIFEKYGLEATVL